GAKANLDFPTSEMTMCLPKVVWVSFGDGSVEQLARVANYGVSRGLTRRTADRAPVALPFPENITRKVNQYRGFIGYRHPHFLKGRFILDGTGRVEWIHRPQVDTEGFVILYRAEGGAARIFVARHA
ncbi:MAG: hypothetical protein WA645_03520, partial [Pseudolabrys sp.]